MVPTWPPIGPVRSCWPLAPAGLALTDCSGRVVCGPMGCSLRCAALRERRRVCACVCAPRHRRQLRSGGGPTLCESRDVCTEEPTTDRIRFRVGSFLAYGAGVTAYCYIFHAINNTVFASTSSGARTHIIIPAHAEPERPVPRRRGASTAQARSCTCHCASEAPGRMGHLAHGLALAAPLTSREYTKTGPRASPNRITQNHILGTWHGRGFKAVRLSKALC